MEEGTLGRKRILVDRRPEENASPRSHSMVEIENKKKRKKLRKKRSEIWHERESSVYLHYTFFEYLNGTDIISSYVLRLLYVVVVVFFFNFSFRFIRAVRTSSHAFVLDADSHMYRDLGAPHAHTRTGFS